MKKIKYIIILLISIILLTGCGETESDYKNASDPKKFVKESFENYYKKEIEITKVTENGKDNDKTTLFELSLKDDSSFKFNACSYWDISAAIPKRYYTTVNNYENIYAEKFLKEKLDSKNYGTLSFEQKTTRYNDVCELDVSSATYELNDISKIDELSNTLYQIIEDKEIYAINLKVVYQDKKVSFVLNNDLEELDILNQLTELKNS